MTSHLKRLNAPAKWPIHRKGIKFTTKQLPGAHDLNTSLPLNIIIRDLLKYANTSREVRNILQNKNVLINGIKRKEPRFAVGLFDVIEIKETKEHFRMVLTKKGKINLIKIDKADADLIPCKIKNKSMVAGKFQLNLSDGSNILLDKNEYKTGDTLLLSIPGRKIKKVISFGKKVTVYLTGGKNIGEIGIIDDIKQDKIVYKLNKGTFETSKEYAFAIGEEKPEIKV